LDGEPRLGFPRIAAELLKLGLRVPPSTIRRIPVANRANGNMRLVGAANQAQLRVE
jgi:hypothetical protein